jgi:hypothetical protein
MLFLTYVLVFVLSYSLALPVPDTHSLLLLKRQKNFEDPQDSQERSPPLPGHSEELYPTAPRYVNRERFRVAQESRTLEPIRPINPPRVEQHAQRPPPMLTRPRPHLSFLHRLMNL